MITPEPLQFKSSEFIFSKVKRDLSSFDTAGIIDEGEFPTYVKEVLNLLGLGVFEEQSAVVAVKDYRACLPENFSKLYAAYKCTPFIEAKDLKSLQGNPITYYNEVTWELLEADKNCTIQEIVTDSDSSTKVIEKVTIQQQINDQSVSIQYKNPTLLRLSPNVKPHDCTDDCLNLLASSIDEITIQNKTLFTNFTNDSIYVKYYGFPKDDVGLPLVPDMERVEKAIEWCIKFNLLYNWWLNNSVPDLQTKWQDAEHRYDAWMTKAREEIKMPSFTQMVNYARKQRAVNKVQLFSNMFNS